MWGVLLHQRPLLASRPTGGGADGVSGALLALIVICCLLCAVRAEVLRLRAHIVYSITYKCAYFPMMHAAKVRRGVLKSNRMTPRTFGTCSRTLTQS